MTETQDQIKELQAILISRGLVDPPADGQLGPQTKAARKNYANIHDIEDDTERVLHHAKGHNINPIKPINNAAALIVEECQRKKYFLSRGIDAFNIIYIEGVNSDFAPNDNRINEWNDLRLLFVIEHNGRAYVRNLWKATVNSGRYYTDYPMNDGGAANIEPGQYWAWQVGRHITRSQNHEALVQVRPVSVRRDANKDGRTSNDKIEDWAIIGLNQHGGNGPKVDRNSAGCLTAQGLSEQQEFMNILKTDRRYKVNPYFIFPTAILTNSIFK